MHKFTIRKIKEIKGKQDIYLLLINDICEFDEFWRTAEQKGYNNKLAKIQGRFEYLADCRWDYLPETKFKELTGRKRNDKYKDYELRRILSGFIFLMKLIMVKLLFLAQLKETRSKIY